MNRRPLFESLELRRLMAVDVLPVSYVNLTAPAGESIVAEDSISDDGRYVVFLTRQGESYQAYLRDLSSGILTPLPTDQMPSISGDGSKVVFASKSTNLVNGIVDNNNSLDVFLYDIATQQYSLVSRSTTANQTPNFGSSNPRISGDGSKIVFRSAGTNLVDSVTDANNQLDIFVYDVTTQTTKLVSKSAIPNQPGNNESSEAWIGADGTKIVFTSLATNLVDGVTDNNAKTDIFLFDIASETLSLVSKSAVPGHTGNNAASDPRISDDGNKVVFVSLSTDHVSGVTDNNNFVDAFYYDALNETLSLVSASTAVGKTANAASQFARISGDGSKIVLNSQASDLISGVSDDNNDLDIFLYETATGTLTLVTHSVTPSQTANSFSASLSISTDGNRIALFSPATDLISGYVDTPFSLDAFVYDVLSDTFTLLSESLTPNQTGNGHSTLPYLSGDGSTAVFTSWATDLIDGASDGNAMLDAFAAIINLGAPGDPILTVTNPVVGNEDIAIALTINASPADPDNETLSIIISGVPAGAILSAGTDMGSGVWHLTPAQLSGLTITPPANSDVDLQLTVTARATNTSNGESSEKSRTINVQVVAVADAPSLTAEPAATGNEDTAVPLNISASLADTDGSETLYIDISGVPQGAYLSAGSQRSPGIWRVTPADLANLTITPPAHSDADFALTAIARAFESGISKSGDSASTIINVTVNAVADAPNVLVDDLVGYEDTANPLSIHPSRTDADGSETLSIIVSGVPTGATLSAGTNLGGGEWQLTPAQLSNLKITPPTNSDADFTLTVTARSTEASNGDTADTVRTLDVQINAVADTPHLTVDLAAGNEDTPIPLTINASLADTDGSENLLIVITNLPTGATLSAGINFGLGTWYLSPSDLAGLTYTPALHDDGDYMITVTAVATETSNGVTAEANGVINVGVFAVADEPELELSPASGRANRKVPLSIDASLVDSDGSESLTVRIAGAPAGSTFWNGNVQVGIETSPGNGIWQFTAAQLPSLAIVPPANSPSVFQLTVTVFATEADNGDQAEVTESTFVALTLTPAYNADEILVVGADAGARPVVKVIDAADGRVITRFLAYSEAFTGGVRVAVADLNGDGEAEIIVAPGAGMSTLVKVFTTNGKELVDFRTKAYTGFTGGVFIAAGDVNGDGRPDVITTPGSGLAANVKVFKNRVGIVSANTDPISNNPISSFMAFGSAAKHGATVAAGDFTGDGKADIVVGNGPGRSPIVRVFDATTIPTQPQLQLPSPILELRPFDSADRGGVFVAAGNVRGDARPEIIVGNGAGGRGRVEMYDANGTRFKSLTAYSSTEGRNAPVHVAAKNVNGTILDEIITAQGPTGGTGQVRAFSPDGTILDNDLVDDTFENEEDLRFGFFIA